MSKTLLLEMTDNNQSDDDDGDSSQPAFEVDETVFVRGYATLQGKIVRIDSSGPFPKYVVEFNNNEKARRIFLERDISVENEFGSCSDVDGNALATLAAREGLEETTSHAVAKSPCNFVFACGACIACGKSHRYTLEPPPGTLCEGCIGRLWKVKCDDEETEEYTCVNQQHSVEFEVRANILSASLNVLRLCILCVLVVVY